jgi:hypothetical protein
MAIFYFLRSNKLHNELAHYEQNNSNDINLENYLRQLILIDSLLINNNYEGARKAYDKLLNEVNNNEFAGIIQNRMSQLKEKQAQLLKNKDLDNCDKEQVLLKKSRQIDSLINQVAKAEKLQEDTIDSLKFALAKANMRMESLTEQLASKSKSDYLKFNGEKGTEIYYVGVVEDNKANGWGVGLYSNASRYEGEWKDNLRHGNGVFYWPDGEYYSGEFVMDQRQGEGKYYWPNGEMFAGEWQNDKRNGEGVFYGKNGEVVAKGIWQNNELVRKE